jgi:DhnA family fructose-bisphosphate aldolase class Ia
MPAFSSTQLLSGEVVARITEIRISDPTFAQRESVARVRRQQIAPSGRLNILAADHPARRVTQVADDPIRMADRRDYLARIVRVLSSDSVDGVMATMDILEDLLIVDSLRREARGKSVLDSKLLIASLNRGGLAGSSWELDDPMTGPSPATCKAWGLDGVKILLRVADEDSGSLKTMLATAQAITEANAQALPTFLEPLPVVRNEKGWKVNKTCEALARVAGVAAALGDSSRHLWLKLPWCEGFPTVARATTLPILLLGGESAGDPSGFLNELASGLEAGPNVRGALVGRNVLYPGADDPLAVAEAVGGIIHKRWPASRAMKFVAEDWAHTAEGRASTRQAGREDYR